MESRFVPITTTILENLVRLRRFWTTPLTLPSPPRGEDKGEGGSLDVAPPRYVIRGQSQMRLLEHQSKTLLKSFGLSFTEAIIVGSSDAAAAAASELGGAVVLKAQVPFGGRGKAGAVKFADTREEARRAAEALLAMQLRGVKVTTVSVEPKIAY